MINKAIILMLFGALALTGCQTVPVGESEQVTASGSDSSQPLRTTRYHIRQGIKYLNVGQPTQARQQFQNALEISPSNRTARSLIEQIDADPVQALGRQ